MEIYNFAVGITYKKGQKQYSMLTCPDHKAPKNGYGAQIVREPQEK